MAHLIEVAFKGNRKDFFIWEQDDVPALKSPVVVEADRGEDIGRVHSIGEQASVRNAGTAHGYGKGLPARRARRLASPDEVIKLDDLRTQDVEARSRAMERARANGLEMKVSDAEWQWDRKKLTFYFTAEKRVDFRTLVRELASTFRTRIELKQIGVRDEAKRLDGVGRCGRPYCSSSWLPELLPVNLGVAKDQRLSLNPTQISGACGRLMCCLRYEHEFYVQSRKRFPKENRVLTTSQGEMKVVANDIFRERVSLRAADGELHIVPLDELREEVLKTDPSASWLRHAAKRPEAAEPPTSVVAEQDVDERDPEEPDTDDGDIAIRMEAPRAVQEAAPAQNPAQKPAQKPAPKRAQDSVQTPTGAPHDTAPANPTDAAAPEIAGGGERRPHRRRGRRGGRRNRGGNQQRGGPDDQQNDGGAPPSSAPPAPPSTGA